MAGHAPETMSNHTKVSENSGKLQHTLSMSETVDGAPAGSDCATVQSTGEKLKKASLAPQGSSRDAEQTSTDHHPTSGLSSDESSRTSDYAVAPDSVQDHSAREAPQIDPVHLSKEVDHERLETGYAKKRSRGIEGDVRSGDSKRTQVEPGTSAEDPANGIGPTSEPHGHEPAAESPLRHVRRPSLEDSSVDTNMPVCATKTEATKVDSQSSNLNIDRPASRTPGETSPRRKRSRDQLDAEADRDQKIAATDEIKAQRLSGELNREHADSIVSDDDHKLRRIDGDKATNAPQQRSVFGSTSSVLKDTRKPEDGASEDTSISHISSTSAFAASGFAALAASSSPFKDLTSPLDRNPGIFNAGESVQPPSSDRHGSASALLHQKPTSSISNSSRAPAPVPEQSGTQNRNVFGSSFIGPGFNAGATHPAKLTSFAAPNGDANFGFSSGNIKPIGSPPPSAHDEESSVSDANEVDEDAPGDSKSEANELLQGQDLITGEDGEESLFASRASLFAFRQEAWKESGKGIFKFNVSEGSDESTPRNGRFILRAHQTYRVLLNAPIFKQMKVGDSRGDEPTGKSFAFAVIEGGKAIPHMVKLGDVKESKSLYQAVRKLQQELE